MDKPSLPERFVYIIYTLLVIFSSVAIHEYTHIMQAGSEGVRLSEACYLGQQFERTAETGPYFSDNNLNSVLISHLNEGPLQGWVRTAPGSAYNDRFEYGIEIHEREAVTYQLIYIFMMSLPLMYLIFRRQNSVSIQSCGRNSQNFTQK